MSEHRGSCHCQRIQLVLRDSPTDAGECTLLVTWYRRGPRYEVAGFLSWDRHFFGIDGEAPILLLGSDGLGRDLLSRLLLGGQISLLAGLLGAGLATTIVNCLMCVATVAVCVETLPSKIFAMPKSTVARGATNRTLQFPGQVISPLTSSPSCRPSGTCPCTSLVFLRRYSSALVTT